MACVTYNPVQYSTAVKTADMPDKLRVCEQSAWDREKLKPEHIKHDIRTVEEGLAEAQKPWKTTYQLSYQSYRAGLSFSTV